MRTPLVLCVLLLLVVLSFSGVFGMANCNAIAAAVLDSPTAQVVVAVGASVPLSGHWTEVAGPRPCSEAFSFRVRDELTGVFVADLPSPPAGIDAGVTYADSWVASSPGRFAVRAVAQWSPNGWPAAPIETVESAEVSVRVLKAAVLDDFLGPDGFGVQATIGGVSFRGIYQDPHASALGMAGRNPTLQVEAARADGVVVQGDLVTIVEKPGLSWIVRGQAPRVSGLVVLKLEAL